MGAKGVKAMVIDDKAAPGVEIANKELFEQGRKKLTEAIQEHGLTKKDGGLNSYRHRRPGQHHERGRRPAHPQLQQRPVRRRRQDLR